MSSSRKRALSVDGAERGDGGGRSSERQGKASRKKRVTIAETEKQEPVKAVSKGKRQAWTAPAMAAFFEGLFEHGKDFGRILQFMQTKHKKKQDAFIGNLNRNQVRFFYYRTWHKVSALLSTSHKTSSHAAKKLSIPETEPIESVNSPPPPPQSLPAPPQSSTSQPLPSQPPNSTNEREAGSLTTTGIDVSAGEETEGEAGFDTSLDEVCEEPIENQTCEEETTSRTVTAVLRNVFGEENSSTGPSLTNEDSSSVTVVSATLLGGTPDKLPVVSSPKDSRVETKKEKGEGGGMITVNGTMFSLDLVALICYSKLKQKCGDKQAFGKKLHELIFTGITTIRMKGKRKIQVKIPNCPALRNTAKTTAAVTTDSKQSQDCPNVTDTQSEKGSGVTVDLQPVDTSSWAFVQQQSMNPRIRVSLQADRRVEELLSFIASRWHVPEHKQHAHSVQLFSCPPSAPSSAAVASPRSQSLTSPLSSNDPITPPCPHPLKSKEESTRAATKTTSHVPQPLHISSDMTISNLQHKLSHQSSSGLSLRYRILYDKATQEQELDVLLRLAEFLLSAEHSQSSQEQRQIVTTPPTGVSGSVLTNSPSVAEYIRSLPKRSPIKSPLAKYRRMKQLRQQSPLRMSTERRHKVATRLVFESGQTSSNPSTAAESSTPSFLSVTPPSGIRRMTLPDLSQSAPQMRARDSAQDSLMPIVSSPQTPLSSPVALGTTDKGKRSKMREPHRTHLVTVSKKSLRSSGSFSRLDLSNIFTAVSQNLKDANASQAQTQLPTTNSSSASVTQVTSSTQQSVAVSSHGQMSILTTAGNPSQQSLTTDSGRTESQRERTAVSNPSPLEQLATQVVGHPLTPANLTTSAKSIVTPSSTTTTSSFVAPLKKPTRRNTKPRNTTRNSHYTPRPVIPKPLCYLPNMTQQQLTPQILSSIAPSSSSFITAPVVAQPQSIPTTVQTSPKPLTASGRSLNHSPSQMRPIQSAVAAGKVTPQALQAQMISLLQSMLQQQMKGTSQQGTAKQQQPTSTQPMQHPPTNAVSATAIQPLSSAPNAPLMNVPTSFPPSTTATSISPGTQSLDLDQLIDPLMPPLSSNEPVHASSDTVNELLRGLYSTSREEQQQESLKRLSEETADVLPTFAKAVIQMGSSSSQQSSSLPVEPVDNDGAGQVKDSSGSSDSLLAFLQGEGSAVGTDSNLKQLTDQVDFTDVFSQLKDIICTPEKHRDPISYRPLVQHDGDWDAPGPSGIHDTENSLNVILADLLNSPFKQLARDAASSVTSVSKSSSHTAIDNNAEQGMPSSGEGGNTVGGEMTLRSILEENSVDYITRFKELASTMNQSST